MNEIRLIIRFATQPELLDKDTKSPVVRCSWQDLERQENILVQFVPLATFTFFFGKTADIVLTDTYYIEGHLTKAMVNSAERQAGFQISIDRAINTTEGRFGDKVLENVRHKPTIRTVKLSSSTKENGSKEIAGVFQKQDPFQALDNIVSTGKKSIESIGLTVGNNAESQKIAQAEKIAAATETSQHELLASTLADEAKKKAATKVPEEQRQIIDMDTTIDDDLPTETIDDDLPTE